MSCSKNYVQPNLTKEIRGKLSKFQSMVHVRPMSGLYQVHGLWTLDFFYRLWMTQGYQLDHSLSQRLSKHFFDNVLLEHVGLIRVLPLTVHLFFVLSR